MLPHTASILLLTLCTPVFQHFPPCSLACLSKTHTNTLPVTSPPVLSIPSHLIPAYYSHTFTPTCAATTIPSSFPLLSLDCLHVILPLLPLSLMAHVVLSGQIIFFQWLCFEEMFLIRKQSLHELTVCLFVIAHVAHVVVSYIEASYCR